MLLGAHETVLRSAYAVVASGTGGGPRRRPGVLYLTSERVVFEAPASRGIVRDLVAGRETEILVDEPLARLRNVSVRKGRWARPRLVVDRGEHRAAFDVLEPEEWVVAIAEARRRAELVHEAARGALAPPGRSVVKVRCRYCGGLGDETSDRCPSCGAPF
ncbi:MAG TPA: hypothetical protein VEH10_01835 [Thermoplasmata archaeon]|nr:hypothetical protein [Thermoplasmata archaeon]